MSTQTATHLTVAELAKRWSVSTAFVRRAIRAGALKATRFGRAVRVAISSADEFTTRNTSGHTK